MLNTQIFRVSKYEEKIKDGKIWEYQNKGVPLKKNQTLTTYAGQMKFSELVNKKKDEISQNLGVPQWGCPLNEMPKFKLFCCFS